LPEREGWIDREQMYDIEGRSRKRLIELAKKFGLKEIPTPSTGCSLTEPRFSQKVFDLFDSPGENHRWDFELLKVGRHFRFDAETKVILGRDEAENDQLGYAHELPDATSTAMLTPENFYGPRALLLGPKTDVSIEFAAGLVLRYSRDYEAGNALVRVDEELVNARETEEAGSVATIASM
jgi:tRNA-uridine 2-sulfurtransferase